MHKDAEAKKPKKEDDYRYEEPMSLGWFIALTVAGAVAVSATFMGLVWIATA